MSMSRIHLFSCLPSLAKSWSFSHPSICYPFGTDVSLCTQVYPGIASQASFFLNKTEPAFGSIFQIGWAYAIGIAFAIIVCGPTSGGHFNPAITICFAVWQG